MPPHSALGTRHLGLDALEPRTSGFRSCGLCRLHRREFSHISGPAPNTPLALLALLAVFLALAYFFGTGPDRESLVGCWAGRKPAGPWRPLIIDLLRPLAGPGSGALFGFFGDLPWVFYWVKTRPVGIGARKVFGQRPCGALGRAYSRGLGESVTRGDRRGCERGLERPAPPVARPREYTARDRSFVEETGRSSTMTARSADQKAPGDRGRGKKWHSGRKGIGVLDPGVVGQNRTEENSGDPLASLAGDSPFGHHYSLSGHPKSC